MFGLIPRKAAKRAAAADGGALLVPTFLPFGGALFPELDRVFDRFFREWGSPIVGAPETRYGVEVEDKPGEVMVRIEMPGFDAKDLEVEARDETLILHAIKEKKTEVKGETEKTEGKCPEECLREEFREVIELPAPVIAEKATAKYVSGVLTVTLPKTEEAKGRRVPVTT